MPKEHTYKGRIVIIDVRGGVATVVRQDKGTKVIIRDFDCQEDTELQDKDGKFYGREEYEA